MPEPESGVVVVCHIQTVPPSLSLSLSLGTGPLGGTTQDISWWCSVGGRGGTVQSLVCGTLPTLERPTATLLPPPHTSIITIRTLARIVVPVVVVVVDWILGRVWCAGLSSYSSTT